MAKFGISLDFSYLDKEIGDIKGFSYADPSLPVSQHTFRSRTKKMTPEEAKATAHRFFKKLEAELYQAAQSCTQMIAMQFYKNWKSLYTRRWNWTEGTQSFSVSVGVGGREKLGITPWKALSKEWAQFKGAGAPVRFYNYSGQLARAVMHRTDLDSSTKGVAMTVTLDPAITGQTSTDSRYTKRDGTQSQREPISVMDKFMWNEFGPNARPAYTPLRDFYRRKGWLWIKESMEKMGHARNATQFVTGVKGWVKMLRAAGIAATKESYMFEAEADRDSELSSRRGKRTAGGRKPKDLGKKQRKLSPAIQAKLNEMRELIEEYEDNYENATSHNAREMYKKKLDFLRKKLQEAYAVFGIS
jgi:hypothetical protein